MKKLIVLTSLITSLALNAVESQRDLLIKRINKAVSSGQTIEIADLILTLSTKIKRLDQLTLENRIRGEWAKDLNQRLEAAVSARVRAEDITAIVVAGVAIAAVIKVADDNKHIIVPIVDQMSQAIRNNMCTIL